jgi:hypothetical protein
MFNVLDGYCVHVVLCGGQIESATSTLTSNPNLTITPLNPNISLSLSDLSG